MTTKGRNRPRPMGHTINHGQTFLTDNSKGTKKR
jgi:hypothetical protein